MIIFPNLAFTLSEKKNYFKDYYLFSKMISMKSVIHSVTDVTKASNNLCFCLMY